MISYQVYKLTHLFGIFLLFASLGGLTVHALNGGTKESNKVHKLVVSAHGLALLFILTCLPILIGALRNPWLAILLAIILAVLAGNLWTLSRGLKSRGRLDVTFLPWGILITAMFLVVALAAPL